MRVLCIEDDDIIARIVELGLKPLGFAVDRVPTAEDGEAALAVVSYEAIILDLHLPDTDGMTVLKRLRARRNTTPILILSSRSRTGDRIEGLNAGADDYLPKPFDVVELAARLQALARRPSQMLNPELVCANLVLQPANHTVMVNGEPLPLPRREASVLEHLLRNPSRVVAKSAIEDRLYAFGEEVSSNSVEVHIHHLRKRLSKAGARVHIKTLRGTGYMLIPQTSD
jgi:DNA-binding response OmpR family regulator